MQLAVGFHGGVPAPAAYDTGVHDLVLGHLFGCLERTPIAVELGVRESLNLLGPGFKVFFFLDVEDCRALGLYVDDLEALLALAAGRLSLCCWASCCS